MDRAHIFHANIKYFFLFLIIKEKNSIRHKIFYCDFYIDTKLFNISGMAYSTGGQFEACKQINYDIHTSTTKSLSTVHISGERKGEKYTSFPYNNVANVVKSEIHK